MHRFIVLLACLLCLAGRLATAEEVVSCVALPHYYTPGYTYKIEDTKDPGECCSLCAYDKDCVVWSWEKKSSLCALKNDTKWFMGVDDVVSGVKYVSYAAPELSYNDIHAYVLFGKGVVKPVQQEKSVSVSASAVSYGGSSFSSASATPDALTTHNKVTGHGSAHASVETPKYSLASSVTKEHYKPPKYVVKYYKKPTIVAEVKTVSGKVVPILVAEDEDVTCYRCGDFLCFRKKALSFEYSEYVYAQLVTESDKECCHKCKATEGCRSWWWSYESKKCVLNSDVPKPTVHYGVIGGTVL